jgi:flagellar protein FlgJ
MMPLTLSTSSNGIATPASGDVTADALRHRKLADAAQQFEGMFLQQMLKPLSTMGKDDAHDDKGDDDKAGDVSTYQSLGVEAMAKAISAAGGLGIAKNIVASVEKQSHQKELDAKPGEHQAFRKAKRI